MEDLDDLLLDLKPHKEKVFGRMQRMYEYWQEKKVQEKWPQELLALKEYSLELDRDEYPWFSLQTFSGNRRSTSAVFLRNCVLSL